MDKDNRPRGREKNVTSGGGSVKKRGSGLGTGPVGNTNGYSGRKTGSTAGTQGGSRPSGVSGASQGRARTSGGSSRIVRSGGISIGSILMVVVIFFLVKSFIGGSDSTSTDSGTGSGIGSIISDVISSGGSSGTSSILSLLTSSDYTTTADEYSSSTSSAATHTATKATLDTTVAAGSRAKRTTIYGDGKDTVTIMVYMCGTDLESKYGMGTADLTEMCNATLSDNVNLIVYTGGCKSWNNNIISSSVNQIYKIENGGLVCLEKDMGSAAMTKSSTLTEFIKYCVKNYPANRQELIFWDHGGGSISGYGYDEKNSKSGSMTLAGINTALKDAGTTFDFIGFDACLMATVENAMMLADYADYMIASEETEPGVGWYYTNWLTKLSADTSMATINIGKNIIDDFVDVCNQKCAGQTTTLSIVDLAEVENTVPSALTSFAKSTNELIQAEEYKQVSDARYNTREFAESSKIDQIDLVHFAKNLNTDESNKLATALTGAVKYNRTSSTITDAYGLSIYFPYKSTSSVDSAVTTYDAIGMDSEYARCIQEFASLEVSGQVSQGGSNSVLSSLLGSYSDYSSSSSGGSVDSILSMLSGMTSGSGSTTAEGLSSLALSFLSGRSLSTDRAAQYLSDNFFDASALVWTKNSAGQSVIALSDDQWDLIEGVDLNVFYDDGEGYIDLGIDNSYDFDDDGNLIGDYDRTWLAVNGQVVAYYHVSTVEDGMDYTISGYIPAYLNGERVQIMVIFNNEYPYGYITGAQPVYTDGETQTVAKTMLSLNQGDTLDFICDYYSYDGDYEDSYYLGEQMTLGSTVEISNVSIGNGDVMATYRFTDIYQQEYWTPVVE